ncbi:MAG: hypothetical protein J6P16_02135 [Eubacterium sp.]|nr:hypothetical protein [Eubacterium sp.]
MNTKIKNTELMRNAAPDEIKPGLQRVLRLCFYLGDPQKHLRIIHIAGTNGKGSVGAFITSVLARAGYVTGWFSSPAVMDASEMIRIVDRETDFFYQNENIYEDDIYKECIGELDSCVDRMKKIDGLEPSVFEKQTALMYLYFYKKNVDAAVVECGMGGGMDATNVTDRSMMSVFTHIDIDHTAFLGDTIEKIAEEKSGIIKPDSVTVCPVNRILLKADSQGISEPKSVTVCPEKQILSKADSQRASKPDMDSADEDKVYRIIKKRAKYVGAEIYPADMSLVSIKKSDIYGSVFSFNDVEYEITLAGEHQIFNAVIAIRSLNALKEKYPKIFDRINDKVIKTGIQRVRLAGRMEIVCEEPFILYDGAHNPDGVRALCGNIDTFFHGERIYAIMGVFSDKDYHDMVKTVTGFADFFVAVKPDGDRGLSEELLADEWNKQCLRNFGTDCKQERSAHTAENIDEAIGMCIEDMKKNGKHGRIVIFGSLSMRRNIDLSKKPIYDNIYV